MEQQAFNQVSQANSASSPAPGIHLPPHASQHLQYDGQHQQYNNYSGSHHQHGYQNGFAPGPPPHTVRTSQYPAPTPPQTQNSTQASHHMIQPQHIPPNIPVISEQQQQQDIASLNGASSQQQHLNQQQASQLRAQVNAYRHLARNDAIPQQFLDQSVGLKGSGAEHAPERQPEKSQQLKSESARESLDDGNYFKQMYSPAGLLKLFNERQQRKTVVPKPVGMDPVAFFQERELAIENRMCLRIKELEDLMPAALEESQRQKTLTELYSLRLVNMQRQLRNEVLNAIRPNANLHTAPYLHLYCRPKKITLADARLTERIEQQRRADFEAVKRMKHLQFLDAILRRHAEMKETQMRVRSARQRINKSVITWHANEEVRQKREAERQERERMRLLREEDEEGYRKLVDEKKHKRLAYLLKQTDEYVDSLAMSVHEHKTSLRRHKDKGLLLSAAAPDESSQDSTGPTTAADAVAVTTALDGPVKLIETATGKILQGDEVPKGPALERWMVEHPGWEVVVPNETPSGSALTSEAARALEKAAMAEARGAGEAANEARKPSSSKDTAVPDDEYTPLQPGNANYYQLAHTTKEEVKEQPAMIVGGQLKEYQIHGLEWLVSLYNNNLNGILADEMGLGKTIQTIALISYLIETKGVRGPYLIIVPLSTLSNWMLEFDRWSPSVDKIAYKGTPQVRKSLQYKIRHNKFQVLLTTYEYVIKDKGVLAKTHWKYMIIDEGHRMKNHHCKLTVTLNTYYKAPQRLLLTGTPLQNKLPELWALLNFILPSIFKSCANFEQWFNAPFQTTGEKVELNEEESMLIIRRLHKVLRPFLLRRLKKEVESQLPEKLEHIIKCDMSALQRALYTAMQRRGVLIHEAQQQKDGKAGGRKQTALQNTLMQLRKICNHPFMFEGIEKSYARFKGYEDEVVHGADLYRAAGKFELLERILPKLYATGHKVLIFCQMTTLMTIMEDYFNWKNYKYMRLDGTTKADDRGALLKKFSDPQENYFIFVLSTRAGGLGLNLQSADTVIIFDSDWNPHQDLQAQDRAHRIGQKNEVRVLRLITAHSIEEKILAAAQYKLGMDKKIIQAGMFNQRSTHMDRENFLMDILNERAGGKGKKSAGQKAFSKSVSSSTLAKVGGSSNVNDASNEGDNSLSQKDESNAEAEEMNDDDCLVGDDEADEEDEFPDSDQINEMLARGPNEFELFTRMDMEVKKQEMLQPGGPVPPLIEEKELPEFLMQVVDDLESPAALAAAAAAAAAADAAEGGGRRARKAGIVNYADELSEADFLRACEEGNYDELGMFTQKRGQFGNNDDAGGGDSDEDSTSPKKRKRGRPSRASQAAAASGKNGELPEGGVITPPALLEQMQMLVDKLLAFEDEEGRVLSRPFKRLPTKADLPDYYEVIARPMDFRRIQLRLKHADYPNMEEFMSEIELMFRNAQTYNREDSQIYLDAVVLSKYILEAQQMVAKEFAEREEARKLAKEAAASAKQNKKNDATEKDEQETNAEGESEGEEKADIEAIDGAEADIKSGRKKYNTKRRGGFFGGSQQSASKSHKQQEDESSNSDEEFRPAARRSRGASSSAARGSQHGARDDAADSADASLVPAPRRGRGGRPPGRARGTSRGGRGSRGGRIVTPANAPESSDDDDEDIKKEMKPDDVHEKKQKRGIREEQSTSPVSSAEQMTENAPNDTQEGDRDDVDSKRQHVAGGRGSRARGRGGRGGGRVRGGGNVAATSGSEVGRNKKRKISYAKIYSSSDSENEVGAAEVSNTAVDDEKVEDQNEEAENGEERKSSNLAMVGAVSSKRRKRGARFAAGSINRLQQPALSDNAMHGNDEDEKKAGSTQLSAVTSPVEVTTTNMTTQSSTFDNDQPMSSSRPDSQAQLEVNSSQTSQIFPAMYINIAEPPRAASASMQSPPMADVSSGDAIDSNTMKLFFGARSRMAASAAAFSAGGVSAPSKKDSSQPASPASTLHQSGAITQPPSALLSALLNMPVLPNSSTQQQPEVNVRDAIVDSTAVAQQENGKTLLHSVHIEAEVPSPKQRDQAQKSEGNGSKTISALSPRAGESPLSPDPTAIIRRSSEFAMRMDANTLPDDGSAIVRCAPPADVDALMLLDFAEHQVMSEVVVVTSASAFVTAALSPTVNIPTGEGGSV